MTVKSEILELFEKNKGNLLSGETLAEQLGCTRAAVWKAVKSLRQEGYPIEAGPNKGYVLSMDSNLLSPEAIRLHLQKKAVDVVVLKETDSTNHEAKLAAMEKRLESGSLFVALSQKKGRGRRGRSFYSPENSGIYMSVVLRPEGTLMDNLLLTTSAAAAVCRAVEKVCGISLDIKWVNDLYLNGKKICGILTEAVTDFETGDIDFAVVGIGLNLYLEKGMPKELCQIAGALYSSEKEAEKTDRNLLIGEIVNCLMEETKKKQISPLYVERNIVTGKEVQIQEGDRICRVFAEKICPDGRLLVREENGEERLLAYGEISLRLEEGKGKRG